MRQRVIDRWIEAAEARKFCEWASAEQLPARPAAVPPTAPSLMAKLRAMVMLEVARLRLGFVPSTRPAA